MAKQGTEAPVTFIPMCDFPHSESVKAIYDGATVHGPWANMCEDHFQAFGMGLGMGRGQRYVQV